MKEIKISIVTLGDASGAQTVTQALDAVRQAAQQAATVTVSGAGQATDAMRRQAQAAQQAATATSSTGGSGIVIPNPRNDPAAAAGAAGSTTTANTGAVQAQTQATRANTGATAADTSATQANTGATSANTGAQGANTAATQAGTGATQQNTGATGANTGAAAQNTGATQANTGAQAQNTATLQVNTATTAGNTSATQANAGVTVSSTGTTTSNTGATAANTAATQANTGATGANTSAQGANTGATGANTGATGANAGAQGRSAAATAAAAAAARASTQAQQQLATVAAAVAALAQSQAAAVTQQAAATMTAAQAQQQMAASTAAMQAQTAALTAALARNTGANNSNTRSQNNNTGARNANAGASRQQSKAHNQVGLAAMQAAYFVDDLQYGLHGIVNNLPLMLAAFGLNMGLAGVISIVAVAIKVASDHFDIFGLAAGKAGKKATELIKDVRQATEALNASDLNTANWRRHTEFIDKTRKAVDDLRHSLDAAADSQARLNQLAMTEAEAEAEKKKALVDARLAEGNITETDAVIQKRDIDLSLDRKRFDFQRQETEAKIAGMRKVIDASANEIQRIKNENMRFNQSAEGVKSNEWRTKAEKQIERQDAIVAQYRDSKKLSEQNKGIDAGIQAAMLRSALDKEMKARIRAGGPVKQGGADAVYSQNEAARKEIEKQEQELADARRNLEFERKKIPSDEKVFQEKQETKVIVTGAEITRIQSRENQERQQEHEANQKDEERQESRLDKDTRKRADSVGDRWKASLTAAKLSGEDEDDDDAGRGRRGYRSRRMRGSGKVSGDRSDSGKSAIANVTETFNAMKDGATQQEWDNFQKAITAFAQANKDTNSQLMKSARMLWDEASRMKGQLMKVRE